MRSPNSELTVGQALALGLLQGPAELLPISSSAHTTALAWLRGWRYSELDPELRKSFEVALHLGTALALIAVCDEAFEAASTSVIAVACAPPAIAGYALERAIERRLGTPPTIVVALFAGSSVMALADRGPQRRHARDAGVRDGLWLGLAQSIALIPGISRSGATLSAARFLGFERRDAGRLSTQVGLPVLAGAGLLKAIRLWRRGIEPQWLQTFGVGCAAAFASTLACVRPSRPSGRLLPYVIYRAALASWMLIHLRRGSTAHRQ
jgi:undecaprenyl-diphosphatase